MIFSKKMCGTVFIILIVLFLHGCAGVKFDSEKYETFQNYKSDFEVINEAVLALVPEGESDSIMVVKNEQYEVISLFTNGEDIKLTDSQLVAINRIDELYKTDFSFIDVTPDRISYGGLGNQMYVYSFNGDAPSYFYSETNGDKFKTYSLQDGWFYLQRKSN